MDIPDLSWTFGLNHRDYHGPAVRKKQLQGIDNCIKLGMKVKNISYTLENLNQLEFCLEEIQEFYPNKCQQFRIRVGADIGRNPEGPQIYLSQLVKAAQDIAINKGWSYDIDPSLSVRAHYAVVINGVTIKLIQWPDATTIDLNEMQTETWADLLPGKPISPLIHQVILRDAMINNNKIIYDTIPTEFRR